MTNSSLLRLLADCRQRLDGKGFNVWGITTIEEFNAIQCRGSRLNAERAGSLSAVVVGSGGRALWQHLQGNGRSIGEPRRGYHPIDDFSERALLTEVENFRRLGYEACALFPFDKKPVNFVKLAESAGIGVLSPVVPFLLHPVYGPWISLRGAILLEARIPSNDALADFEPCSGCDSPCLSACPASVYGKGGEVRLDRCADHRSANGCVGGCEVRRACPIGKEHRFDASEEAFRHSYSLPMLRRWFGRGIWRFVPARMRRML